MKFRSILIDIDDTLFDFGKAERAAIAKAYRDYGIEPTEERIARYSVINQAQWEAMERGELGREEVLLRRHEIFFKELGVEIPIREFEDCYRGYLGIGHYFVDGAEEMLEYLFSKYDLYIASNGVAETQYSRMESAGIGKYFKNVFISETTGSYKPEKAYFDYCFARMENFDPQKTLIIGDSLTGDMLGGLRAGIHTCWFNPHEKPGREDIRPHFEIRSLKEIQKIL
jgi:2-haloacid dehalogenase